MDDANPRLPDLNQKVDEFCDIPPVPIPVLANIVRQYHQFSETDNTYELCRQRVNPGISNLLNWLFYGSHTQFLNINNVRLAQTTFKQGNPLRYKVGEGLIYWELLIECVKQNIIHGDPIKEFSHYSSARLVGGSNNTVYPAYNMMVLGRGITKNLGRYDVSVSNSPTLVVHCVKQATNIELYIINTSSASVKMPVITKLGQPTTIISSECYYGDPYSSTASHQQVNGQFTNLQPYSVNKIVVQ